MSSTKDDFIEWLQQNGLLLQSYDCTGEGCGGKCNRCKRTGKSEGHTMRCNKNRNHEYSIKTNSVFSGTKVPLRALMVYFRSFLNQDSMRLSASEAGIDYKHTAVDWSNMIRAMFMEYVYVEVHTKLMKLSGTIEIDESLFGRKVKAHRGNPNHGLKVWIVGLIERDTNKIILYPVENRTSETLSRIIRRHVEPRSRVFTDGWRGYGFLTDAGYEHFVVNHTTTFQQTYRNTTTGEVIQCNTNRIEGAWAHTKKHFQWML